MTKEAAFEIVKRYYNDYYTGAKIKEESIEGSYIKIELDTKIVTLSYNELTGSIDERDRARRGAKKKEENSIARNEVNQKMNEEQQTEETKENEFQKPKRHRRTKAEIEAKRQAKLRGENEEYTQISIFDTLAVVPEEDVDIPEDKDYDVIPEGAIVRNVYNKKDYRVVKATSKNIIEVFDEDHGYLTFARADIEVMVNINKE